MVVEIVDSKVDNYMAKGPFVIDFYADWCQPCKSLSPVLEKVSDEYNITVGKCNIENNDDLIDKYEVRNIPTLIFVKDGKVIDKMTGYKSPDQLTDKIKNLL